MCSLKNTYRKKSMKSQKGFSIVQFLSFFIWALVAFSATYWFMKINASTISVKANVVDDHSRVANGPWTHLFGQPPVVASAPEPEPPSIASRITVVGVTYNAQNPDESLALVSVDNGMPLLLRNRSPLVDDVIVSSIESDHIDLIDKKTPSNILKIIIAHAGSDGKFYVGQDEYKPPTAPQLDKYGKPIEQSPAVTQTFTNESIEQMNREAQENFAGKMQEPPQMPEMSQ